MINLMVALVIYILLLIGFFICKTESLKCKEPTIPMDGILSLKTSDFILNTDKKSIKS